ncbi:MAG TPA: SidA/IucD/PvdA family monooxygenase [Solirubrobacteraceae bacterium]
MVDTDLLVVGAGAKGVAIAIKAHVLNSLGLGPIDLTIVEEIGPAAAWMDGNGVTSSREVLAISPSKDIGFPYRSADAFGAAGEEVDRAALAFSWQQFLVSVGRYARWVDAGSPPVQRREYGRYLAWVLSRATDGIRQVHGRAVRLSLSERADRWVIDVTGPAGTRRYRCRAFALTGPGILRSIPHDPEAAPRLLDCDRGRVKLARVPVQGSSDIAIVGGGESALSCVEFVRSLRPDARLTIYTPGLPMSRIESFLENRVFSNPDTVDWASLSVAVRRDFIARSDRGVFGPDRVSALGYDEQSHFVPGRVTHVARGPRGRGVNVSSVSRAGVRKAPHDYVINCTGFDPLEQLRVLLAPEARVEIQRRVAGLWEGPSEREIAFGRSLELAGMHPRLHLPGPAALSQGPGFANLGSLGLLADRVLGPLCLGASEDDRGLGDDDRGLGELGDLARAGGAPREDHARLIAGGERDGASPRAL